MAKQLQVHLDPLGPNTSKQLQRTRQRRRVPYHPAMPRNMPNAKEVARFFMENVLRFRPPKKDGERRWCCWGKSAVRCSKLGYPLGNLFFRTSIDSIVPAGRGKDVGSLWGHIVWNIGGSFVKILGWCLYPFGSGTKSHAILQNGFPKWPPLRNWNSLSFKWLVKIPQFWAYICSMGGNSCTHLVTKYLINCHLLPPEIQYRYPKNDAIFEVARDLQRPIIFGFLCWFLGWCSKYKGSNGLLILLHSSKL